MSLPVSEGWRPNVLFVIADDLRPALGCCGDPRARTPHLDRLAEGGAVFTRAYCQQAWCAPSRASLLTGLRPDTTGVRDLETHFRANVPDAVTLPQHFRAHGYHAAAFGKVFHETLDDPESWTGGVPAWNPPDVPDPLRHYLLPENVRLAAEGPRRGYAAPTERADVPDDAYADGRIVVRAIGQMERLRSGGGGPFFLAVGLHKPHLPFCAPSRYWDLHDPADMDPSPDAAPPSGAPEWGLQAWAEHQNYAGVPRVPNGEPLPVGVARALVHGYYAAVSYVDALVGRLLDALDRLGLADDTLVVLCADHGWKLGEHGAWSKHTCYEADTRVPLLLRAPGRVRAGTRIDAVVELLDVTPTLAELAGLPAPARAEGASLVPLLRGERTEHRGAAFSQFPRNAARTHTTYARAEVMGRAVRTDRYRLVRWERVAEPGRPLALELYDHADDPGETTNRADDPRYADAVRELSAVVAGAASGLDAAPAPPQP